VRARKLEACGTAALILPRGGHPFEGREDGAPGAMRAGFEVFRAFEQDAKDFAGFAQNKLTIPMLVLTGEKASGNFSIGQASFVWLNTGFLVWEICDQNVQHTTCTGS
jgi:hypothetical protein